MVDADPRDTDGMRVWSFRWWFENRETGEITIGQFPNWPLFAIFGGWILLRVTNDGSLLHTLASIAVAGLWFYWGALELSKGVNPWRRLIGLLVIIWQLLRLIF